MDKGTYYIKPKNDRIARYNFNCYKVEQVIEILIFLEKLKHPSNFFIKDHSINLHDYNPETKKDFLWELVYDLPKLDKF